MNKKGSPHYIQFFSDPDDPHFLIIELRRQKGGAIVTSHYVLKSDLNQWQSMYERDGFVITNNTSNDTGRKLAGNSNGSLHK